MKRRRREKRKEMGKRVMERVMKAQKEEEEERDFAVVVVDCTEEGHAQQSMHSRGNEGHHD